MATQHGPLDPGNRRPEAGAATSERSSRLPPAQIALALLTVAIWGSNFVVIKVGLRDLPPLLFALLRFFFCAVPFVFFLPRPAVPWRWMLLYGVFLGPGQFGLLFYAMRADISPGIASLLIQIQVFFTIGLSVWLFRERLSATALVGSALGAAGLGLIALHLDDTVTAKGVMTVLGAAMAWASANIVVKRAARVSTKPLDMLAFIVWSSIFAVPPLVALTLALEGWSGDWHAIASARWEAWAALAWQVIGNTFFGYAVWNRLLMRYDAAVVAPYALLVPVCGMASSALLLNEPLPLWKLVAGATVIAGILITTSKSR